MRVYHNKEKDYTTISNNGNVYLVSNNYNYIVACKSKNGFYIESRLYNSFTTNSSEAVNEMVDNLVDFCGRDVSSILDKVGNGEFVLKELND